MSAVLPPRTALERTLVDIWSDVLGVDRLGTDDNFFDAGGNSLLAAQALNRVEETLGRRLPLRVVGQSPTVRDLARSISAGAPDSGILVRLASSEAGRNFFCVHGMGGHVLVFAPLARRLRDWTSFYAIEAVGRNDFASRDRTIPAMAERYVTALRRTQPHGPYRVGGYSVGGVIALEMAHQLAGAGEPVDLVALLDTDLHQIAMPLADRAIEFVSRALGMDPPVCLPYAELDTAVRLIRERTAGRGGRAALTEEEIVRFTDIYLANHEAWREYTFPDYRGEAVLFYSTQGAHAHVDGPAEALRALGWTDAVPRARLRSVAVEGDHWTMFSTHAGVLADALVSVLRDLA